MLRDNSTLIGALAHWLAAGKLETRLVLPALQKLAGDSASPVSLFELLEQFEGEREEPLVQLSAHLRESLRQQALRFHGLQKQKTPLPDELATLLRGLDLEPAPEWTIDEAALSIVQTALRTVRELGFLAGHQQQAPELFREVKSQANQILAAACAMLAPRLKRLSFAGLSQLERAGTGEMPGREPVLAHVKALRLSTRETWLAKAERKLKPLPEFVRLEPDETLLLAELESRFAAAGSREEKAQLLDCVCSWSTPSALPALKRLTWEPWAQDRAGLNLALRFGLPTVRTWGEWLQWLAHQERLWQAEQSALDELVRTCPQGFFLIVYSQLPEPDPAVFELLVKKLAASGPVLALSDVLRSWARYLSPSEKRALLGLPEPAPMPVPPPVIAQYEKVSTRVPGPVPALASLPVARPSAQEPPRAAPISAVHKPSVWEKHIQPLFVENWYIVAGIAMVILGSSLLAYYTWDKHRLVRYTLMPAILTFFTWSLAKAGRWIEQKGDEFRTTAAILRGAAIGLLPINFMAMALLSADEQITRKAPALLAMAAIYLAFFGWSLRNWCAAVEPALGNRLGGALLLLNALVAVGPLARTVGHLEGQPLLFCLGAGFYLGFLVMAATLVNFTRQVLTREMAAEKRVPWFVAVSLAITFVQVFVWVHGFMRHLPQAHTYALLVIMAGWLVLYSERRALALSDNPQIHGGESFLGFALLLLGLLMGFNQPTIRIVCFAAAAFVWMYQALSRQHPLHYWIALTLAALGVASVGLLPQFPGPWLPVLGLAAAAGFGLGCRISERTKVPELLQACRGMQVVALVLTVVVAPLAQWHYGSAPLATAGWLVVAASLFAWRALQDHQLRWLHAAMAVTALILPYAGFVDMAHRTAHHNTMVFGLALLSYLWLAVTWWAEREAERNFHRTASSTDSVDGGLAASPSPVRRERAGVRVASAAALLLSARSTVLWFYGALAVAAMLLRVVLGDTVLDPSWYHAWMDYTGPILFTLALVPATYYSRSLVPAGMAFVIMVVLFPELKARLQQSFSWITWGSGLESSISGLALVWLCFFLRPWSFLKSMPEGDRFMGKELFPLRRQDYTLFTWPLMAAALYLLIKVDTWNLGLNVLAGVVPLKTAIALVLSALAWTFIAIYHREQRGAVVGTHLGWICLLAGLSFGYWRLANDPYWAWPPLIAGLVLQALYFLYRKLEPRYPWTRALLTEPTRVVLMAGSAALAILCLACLLDGAQLARMQWLVGFVAAQLVWHALSTRRWLFGSLLFFLVWISLLAATAPGSMALWERVSIAHSLNPTLGFLAAIQLLFLLLEAERALASWPEGDTLKGGHQTGTRLAPLLAPLFALSSALAALLGLAGLVDGSHALALAPDQQLFLLAILLLTARAQISGFMLLTGALLGYAMLHRSPLAALGNPLAQFELLATPWRLALLGCGMVLLAQGIRALKARGPALVAGGFAQPFFVTPSCGWLFWPATVVAGFAALYHTVQPELRESAVQLWAPCVGAVTFALVAWFWRRSRFFAGAGLLLLLANVHLVRVFAGDWLRGQGLSELHLLCLGFGLSLLQASLLRRIRLAERALPVVNLASLGLAGLILALLSINYMMEHDVGVIRDLRFIISGALAWLAGRYFRRAARHPGPGEAAHVALCEALYHFGVVVAAWCATLLVPWFRQPLFTLLALGLPIAYFYARAELGMRAGLPEAGRYRNSAAVLGFVILGLYAFKGVFHVVLFPNEPVTTDYYHYNAPLIMVLALVLLRLHGLGGTGWLSFYGGLALMVGGFFLLTALPGFSPFKHPMASAWCALGLGHFWILLSYARSPVRTLLQWLAQLDDVAWLGLRRSWGLCLLAATQGMTLWGMSDYVQHPYLVAPLLAGAATMFIHQGLIRLLNSPVPHESIEARNWTFGLEQAGASVGVFYLVVAALELLAALHLDFLVPSYLPKEQIIWALLVVWLGVLNAYQFLSRKLAPELVGQIALPLAALVMAHVLYHRPWSDAGLWGLALGALLAAWNPQRQRQPGGPMEQLCAAALLLVPVWLVYFSQAPFETHGAEAALETWPVLATTTTIFLLGLCGRLFPRYGAAGYLAWPRSQFRLFDSTLAWLEWAGPAIYRVGLWFTLLVVGGLQVTHYQTAFAPRELLLVLLLEAALAFGWFYEGKDRPTMLAYYLVQISALAFFASLRRHLMLTTGPWNYEYDVWASLACSFGLAGARQISALQPQTLRVPLLTTMFALPALALVWVVVHGLGVDMALLVVGLHSVMFAYLGKDDRESPYNILALAGFVAFILVTFYSKLQLRAIHAYVVPVGLGILVLQELFRGRIKPETKNWIRLVTLMAMLGSSGYYALADPRHALTFNLTMIILCLFAMGLGSFLCIRLYLAMGFAGLMVDLVSLLYKVLVQMERSSRMTVIGTLVLLIGALLVFGAIYYKTNKAGFDAVVDRWRRKLGQWE